MEGESTHPFSYIRTPCRRGRAKSQGRRNPQKKNLHKKRKESTKSTQSTEKSTNKGNLQIKKKSAKEKLVQVKSSIHIA